MKIIEKTDFEEFHWDEIAHGYVFNNFPFSKNDESCSLKEIIHKNYTEQTMDSMVYIISEFDDCKGITAIIKGEIYNELFDDCYELSDNMLLLYKQDDYKEYRVYSVEKNDDVEEFEWLSNGYNIIPMKTDEGKAVLHVIKEIGSEKENDYIQFIVDTEHFMPITEVHSTLTDKYIKVETPEDVEAIIAENMAEKQIMDFYLSKVNESIKDDATVKLLSKVM